jgi:hypothetical protein
MKACSRAALAALIALGALALARPAAADYCRTKACDNQPAYDDTWQTEPDPPCDRDPDTGCLLEGTPLYWPERCISFSVQRDGSVTQGIDFETARATVAAAFDAWQTVDCGDGATPSFAIKDYSPATCNKAEYNQDSGNANIFMFRDNDWPYTHADDTLALTTITYNTENAQIYDADVEINSWQATFTFADNADDTQDDLQAVLTHECGHFLGLSHDSVIGSTMYPQYYQGDLYQRTPNDDDRAGICDIYPPGDTFDANACAPRHGLSRECGDTKKTSSCGVNARGTGGAGSSALGLLIGLGLVLQRRRARPLRNAS